MSAADNPAAAQQSKRFLYFYALAVAGGAVAYIPFLTMLLPIQATMIWGKEALSILAQASFAGAIAASLANIGFGWASDTSKMRRPWIMAGMLLSSAMLPVMHFASSSTALFVLIIFWQVALNMMLAPLAAWAGDCVPDEQKGLLGGLLSFAPALGGLAGALVTLPGFADPAARLILISVLVVLCVTPVLVLGRPRAMPHLVEQSVSVEHGTGRAIPVSRAAVRMWLARLFIQIAEASLFAFLLLWFRSVAPQFGDNDAATLFAIVLGLAVLGTLIVGRWSDRKDRPIFPLGICAGIAAFGLLMMALAAGLLVAVAGYLVFGIASSIFLALHSSQTLRVLPSPAHRGRDLGMFNLTNTVPSLIMPWLTLALVPAYGFDALFILLAGLAMAAAVLLYTMQNALAR